MNIYLIRVYASRENSSLPHYAQQFDVSLNDRWEGQWNETDENGKTVTEYPVYVREEFVKASTVFGAVRKFKEWVFNGNSRDWLTQDTGH